MVKTENGWMIVCGVLTLVILFNVGLAISFLRNRGKLFQNAFSNLGNPWREEDEALADLREHVDKLGRETESEEIPNGNE